MTGIHTAQSVVDRQFPETQAAFLAGSVVTGNATSTSDLDIVVVLPGRPAPFRQTVRSDGWLVELFVHTIDSMEHYWAKDVHARRPPLLRMVATGRILASVDGKAEELKQRACEILDAGPTPLDDAELERYRYMISDLLDDLEGATDPLEATYICNSLFTSTSELALLHRRHWIGTGKWLARELRDLDSNLAERLRVAHKAAIDAAPGALAKMSEEVLNACGGRLSDGYGAQGETP